MMMFGLLALAVLLCIDPALGGGGDRINVILLGATGNLAEKYLWQGLYNIHHDSLAGGEAVSVWPAATKDKEKSQPILDRILANNITARDPATKEAFLARVAPYTQLRKPEQYQALGEEIAKSTQESGETEAGRLMYLSVPPKFFGGIADNVNKYLRPSQSGWLRVIVEKPFGVDLKSAEELAKGLYKSLQADEVLLVDHYMGKETMHGMRHFVNNHRMDRIATAESTKGVKHIEVGMLETDDVKGRTGFYDEVGVLRDTIQNHLMMMLALVAMETQSPVDEPTVRKDFFKLLPEVSSDHIVSLGQYKSYNNHVNEDRAKWDEPLLESPSKTPSYAHVTLTLSTEGAAPKYDWLQNVPIHFKSGKALSERRSYVEVVFNSGLTLVFNLQGPSSQGLSGAFIYSSSELGRFTAPNDWTMEDLGAEGFVARPPKSPFAYEFLLRAGLEGSKENFVTLDEVLESWRVWTPLLDYIEGPQGESVQLMEYDHGSTHFRGNGGANSDRDEL